MDLIFATNNSHKLEEVQAILAERAPAVRLRSLSDVDFHEELPETQDTIRGNAIQKAQTLFDRLRQPCFADDTGLMIDSLDGEPGVYSARYAGLHGNFQDNIDKVLTRLRGTLDRRAEFLTVIAYFDARGTVYTFEGRIVGEILETPQGAQGFGYDAIFRPAGFRESFAELAPSIKNRISHRARACQNFTDFLAQQAPSS